MSLCPKCKTRPKQKHFNSKWCLRCAKELRKRPKGVLTRTQIATVKRLAGTMYIKKLAKKVGTSDSNLDRWAKQNGVNINALKYPDHVVSAVTEYYSNHGRRATEDRFPKVRVRSVVERYKIPKPRQIRWKDKEIVLAAKMAGLVDGRTQAKIFNRPGANEGSIKALWMKKFRHAGGNVHGMSEWMAREVLRPGYPVLKTRMWSPRKRQTHGADRGVVLWCDMAKHLKRGLPVYIRDAVKTMSAFQCWLFETSDPKAEILKLFELSKARSP